MAILTQMTFECLRHILCCLLTRVTLLMCMGCNNLIKLASHLPWYCSYCILDPYVPHVLVISGDVGIGPILLAFCCKFICHLLSKYHQNRKWFDGVLQTWTSAVFALQCSLWLVSSSVSLLSEFFTVQFAIFLRVQLVHLMMWLWLSYTDACTLFTLRISIVQHVFSVCLPVMCKSEIPISL